MLIVTAPLLVEPKANCGILMPPLPDVPLPTVMSVPPEMVVAPEAWKFRVLATCEPSTVTTYALLPLVAEGPATKERSSVLNVAVVKDPPAPPV